MKVIVKNPYSEAKKPMKKKARKKARKNPTVKRRKISRRKLRKNPVRRKTTMKRTHRKRMRHNPVVKSYRRRRSVRKNPSMSVGLDRIVKGFAGFGGMVAGLYGGNFIANAIAGSMNVTDSTKKAQYRNLSRIALTLAAAFFLPTAGKLGKYSEAIVIGLMSSMGLGLIRTSFGVDLQTLAGEYDVTPAADFLLSGSEYTAIPDNTFDVSDSLQIGEAFTVDDLSDFEGISELDGISEF